MELTRETLAYIILAVSATAGVLLAVWLGERRRRRRLRRRGIKRYSR